MFAPALEVATEPAVATASASMRVVVVLPLVPDTSAIVRPFPRLARRWGSIKRPTRPPIVEPEPSPRRRETDETTSAPRRAKRVRTPRRRVARSVAGSDIGITAP